VTLLTSSTPATRILVGIAGIPASGKSSFAQFLTDRINQAGALLADRDDQRPAVLVPLDGWHYTRAQLDLFPDPKTARDRRGSHWTFDSTSYVDFVRRLREDAGHDIVISAPSFDHALKDPTPDAVPIHPYHRIVIIEGLYVFLSIEPWKKAGMMLDERCLIEVDPKEARKRLIARHVLTKIAKDVAEANWRADENDIPSIIYYYPFVFILNFSLDGHFVLAHSLEPTQVIQSKDDPTFTSNIRE